MSCRETGLICKKAFVDVRSDSDKSSRLMDGSERSKGPFRLLYLHCKNQINFSPYIFLPAISHTAVKCQGLQRLTCLLTERLDSCLLLNTIFFNSFSSLLSPESAPSCPQKIRKMLKKSTRKYR